jgi:hypothetical protein
LMSVTRWVDGMWLVSSLCVGHCSASSWALVANLPLPLRFSFLPSYRKSMTGSQTVDSTRGRIADTTHLACIRVQSRMSAEAPREHAPAASPAAGTQGFDLPPALKDLQLYDLGWLLFRSRGSCLQAATFRQLPSAQLPSGSFVQAATFRQLPSGSYLATCTVGCSSL